MIYKEGTILIPTKDNSYIYTGQGSIVEVIKTQNKNNDSICVKVIEHINKECVGQQCWVSGKYFTIEIKKTEDILKSWI